MKNLIFASAITFIFSVPSPAQQSTHLDRLLRIYNSSYLPTVNELEGSFSGRCYRTETPSRPFGLLLFARNRLLNFPNPDHGPLFPPQPERSVHEYNLFGQGYQGTEAPPDYWDDYTIEKEQLVQSAISKGEIARTYLWNQSLSADLNHRSLSFSTRLYETDAPDNGGVPGYFITRLHLIPQHPQSPRPLFAACYFFKKVR